LASIWVLRRIGVWSCYFPMFWVLLVLEVTLVGIPRCAVVCCSCSCRCVVVTTCYEPGSKGVVVFFQLLLMYGVFGMEVYSRNCEGVLTATGTFLSSRCLVMLGGHAQAVRRSHKLPLIFQNVESNFINSSNNNKKLKVIIITYILHIRTEKLLKPTLLFSFFCSSHNSFGVQTHIYHEEAVRTKTRLLSRNTKAVI
jgi:hypothetical protein